MLLIVLMILAPVLMFLLSVLAFLFALVGLLVGRIKWARIPNRKAAVGLAGVAAVVFVASAVVGGIQTGAGGNTAVADKPASTPTLEPTLASFVGQSCDADHLVMTQGSESNYCNKADDGAFVWVSQAVHEKDVAAAKEQAEKKAAAEVKAKQEAAAKKVAEEKAKQEAAAEKVAKEKAAAKKAAEAKAAAQAQAEAEKKEAAAAAKRAAAEQAAADAAAAVEAERQAEAEEQAQIETLVEDTAGSSAYYENCSAVRAAGADPIYSGDPGYSRKLDRDGDGVACE